MTVERAATAEEVFEKFCNAVTFKSILFLHKQLCETVSLKPTYVTSFYPKLKEKLNYWKAQALWTKFDKRASHRCYSQGKACFNTRVLVIGCGPCGLRSAIEAQLLGAKVVVVEKRDRFSRHNVLHLWPFIIEDLRSLGAKKFFGKFCAGSIDHISIRQLQCILLKVALLLGVEVHENVGFEDLIEPPEDQSVRIGWRAKLSPADHPMSQYEFDALISADGKRNTLRGFPRKELRGRLAIAITANFVNRHSEAENRVEEISGVAFIFNQKFFRELNQATGIDLENIVYYKDETHYFVMTAKKHSLLNKGVIIQDCGDTVRLLSTENVNREALMDYAREAADFSTNYQLPHLDFALNHYGKPDIAMFDFTSMFAAENASRAVERRGHKLLMQIVGDSLLEPFWPTGSGCARGFLGSFDACWAIRSWSSGRMNPLEVIAERESIYRLLAQTTPENLHKDHGGYTLDPHTRYPNLNTKGVTPFQIRYLYDSDNPNSGLDKPGQQLKDAEMAGTRKRIKRSQSMVSPDALITWLRKQVCHQPDLDIRDTTTSFKDGRALCTIIHRYRPDLIDVNSLDSGKGPTNNQKAFDILQELGIPSIMTGEEMSSCEVPDRLAMLSYLTQVYDLFRCEIPHVKQPKLDLEENLEDELPVQRKATRPLAATRTSSSSTSTSKRRSESREGTLKIGSDRKGDTWRRSRNRRSTEKTLDRRYRRGASDTFNRKVLHLEAQFGGKPNAALKSGPAEGSSTHPGLKDPLPEPPSGPQWRLADRRELFARGNNKVSVMAEKLISSLGAKEEAKPLTKGPVKPLASLGTNNTDLCHFCKKRVYLMERLTAEGKAFHRGCFKCEYCGTMLRLGTYGFVRDEDAGGMFFCTAHLSMAYYLRAQLMKKKEDEGQVATEDPQPKPEEKEKQETHLQHQRVKDEERFLRAGTPERVEFENSLDKTDDKDDESEIDEEEWTDRNFGASLVQDEEESSSSDDDDKDEDPENKEKITEEKEEVEDEEEATDDDDIDIDLEYSDEEFSYEDEEGQSLPESWEEEDLDENWFEEELTDDENPGQEHAGAKLETGEVEPTGTIEMNAASGAITSTVELEAKSTLLGTSDIGGTNGGTQIGSTVECGTVSGATQDRVESPTLGEAAIKANDDTLEQCGAKSPSEIPSGIAEEDLATVEHGAGNDPLTVSHVTEIDVEQSGNELCATRFDGTPDGTNSNAVDQNEPLEPCGTSSGASNTRDEQSKVPTICDVPVLPTTETALNPSTGHEDVNFGEFDPEDVDLDPAVETRNIHFVAPEVCTTAEEQETETDDFEEIPADAEPAASGEVKLRREELTRKSGRKYEPSPGMMRKKEVIYQERERQSDLVRQMVLSRVRTPERTLEKTPLPCSSVQDHERTRLEARAKAQSMADTELGLSPPDYIESLKEKLRKKEPELGETPKSSRPRSFSEPDPLTSFEVETPVRSSIYLWAGLSPTDCDKRLEMQTPTMRKDKSPKKAKDGERRKSFIQAIADFFGVGGASSSDELSPKKAKDNKPKSPSTPKEKTSIFKLGSGSKAKSKLKLDESDSGSRDRSSSSPVSPGVMSGDEADTSRNRSGSLQCTPLSLVDSTVTTPNTGDAAAMSTASRKQLKQMRQAARQAELKRLRMAQSIQRQLEEIEVKQKMLEEQGVNLEKLLRGESGGLCGKDEASLLQEWFQMVHEKNALARYEQELMVKARQLELEDRQARLQQELRQSSPSLLFKSSAHKEEALRTEMKDIDEQLSVLRAQQEQQRQRYGDEEKKDLEARMLAKGFRLNSLRPRKESQI